MKQLAPQPVLDKILQDSLATLAETEGLSPQTIENAVRNGSMVLLANPRHKDVIPTLVGQPSRIKVNANLGTSPFINDPALEMKKLAEAHKAGADAVMDLSTGGDLDEIRKEMLAACPLPLGTVPIYGMAQKYIAAQKDPSSFDPQELFDEIAKQAEQGVDFMTLHMGVTQRAVALAKESERVLGVVSRGGSILARWMRDRKQENPLLTRMDEVFALCKEHNVTISLGDGMRPGAGADAGDPAQWEEVVVLAELVLKAREAGVQTMIEGPGHVPMNLVQSQIQGIKALTFGAPLYVLGPLTTDSAPGYDHIAGAAGGALAGFFGADFLCYLTPAEHLTLPCLEDVRQGVMASRVAAQAAEVALGRERAVQRDLEISKARKNLDWDRMTELALDPDMVKLRRKEHAHEKECAMCGKFCAVKMLDDSL